MIEKEMVSGRARAKGAGNKESNRRGWIVGRRCCKGKPRKEGMDISVQKIGKGRWENLTLAVKKKKKKKKKRSERNSVETDEPQGAVSITEMSNGVT